jgi:hypothetical protein
MTVGQSRVRVAGAEVGEPFDPDPIEQDLRADDPRRHARGECRSRNRPGGKGRYRPGGERRSRHRPERGRGARFLQLEQSIHERAQSLSTVDIRLHQEAGDRLPSGRLGSAEDAVQLRTGIGGRIPDRSGGRQDR